MMRNYSGGGGDGDGPEGGEDVPEQPDPFVSPLAPPEDEARVPAAKRGRSVLAALVPRRVVSSPSGECGFPQPITGTRVISYTYDPLGRLAEAAYSDGDCFQYAYDEVGNRQALTETTSFTQTAVTTYTYDTADRLTNVGGVAYTWDERGNLRHNGTLTFTYDGAGRLVAAAGVTGHPGLHVQRRWAAGGQAGRGPGDDQRVGLGGGAAADAARWRRAARARCRAVGRAGEGLWPGRRAGERPATGHGRWIRRAALRLQPVRSRRGGGGRARQRPAVRGRAVGY